MERPASILALTSEDALLLFVVTMLFLFHSATVAPPNSASGTPVPHRLKALLLALFAVLHQKDEGQVTSSFPSLYVSIMGLLR